MALRRPGANRRGIRGFGGALDTRLVNFNNADFTRNSVAWSSTTPELGIDSIVQAAINVPRIRTVGGLREYLGELSRTNGIEGNSSRLDSASWVLADSATVDSEAVSSVFSGEDADRLNFAASADSSNTCDIQGTEDNGALVASVIAWTESGTKDFRIFVRLRDNTQASDTFTATTTPQLFYFAVGDLLSGATTPQYRLINESGGGAGSIIVGHCQAEIIDAGPQLPSSPIRKNDGAAVTREADLMEFATLPQELIDGLWYVRGRAEHDGVDMGALALVTRGGGAFIQLQNGTVLRARNTAGANTTLATAGNAYAAGDLVHMYGDFRDGAGGNSALEIESATAGVDSVTGAHEPFTDGTWHLGNTTTGGLNINLGLWLTEPRAGKPLV